MIKPGPAPISVRFNRRRAWFAASLLLMLLPVWGMHHLITIFSQEHLSTLGLASIYFWLYAALVWQLIFSHREKPISCTAEEQARIDQLKVAAIIPLYNEDPDVVRQSITSILRQTRPLYAISVTDDGSTAVDYEADDTVLWFQHMCAEYGVVGHWHRRPNGGKRQAQAAAIAHVPEADILCLIDSDSLLDPRATEEAMKGFARPQVMSVASMVAAANTNQNFLTRLMDLWCVTAQFSDRTMMSRFRSVLVNCGALAYYRSAVVLDNLDGYLNERFGRNEMKISDDSLMTLYALLRGETVQQITSWAFTYMPTTFKHHKNQQIRWMRGSFIRSWWRFRYLPATRFAFWGHLFRWIQYVMATSVFLGLLVSGRLSTAEAIIVGVGVQFTWAYAVMIRYLALERTDESARYRFFTFLLYTPLATFWAATLLRVWRWWSAFTCLNMDWGTRKKVEVAVAVEPTLVARPARYRPRHSADFTDTIAIDTTALVQSPVDVVRR